MRPVEYIFGYHYIVPVCREEYIFDIPFPASPSSLLVRYEEYIVSAFLRPPHSRSALSVSSSPSSLHICAAGIYWSTVYNILFVIHPILMLKSLRSPSLTKPLPLRSRALRLTSLVPFVLDFSSLDISHHCCTAVELLIDETSTAEVLHSDEADELTTDEPQTNGHVYIVPWRPEEFIFPRILAPSTGAPPHGYGVIPLVRVKEYIVGYHYIVSVRFVEYIFGIPFSAAPSHFSASIYLPAYPSIFTPRPVFSIRIPVSPLHLPVRFEEYIVGVLFTLISAFLRRPHLPEHQADELITAEDLLTDESVEWFTDETATAEELLSDELTTDASQITVHRWLPLHRPCALRGVHFGYGVIVRVRYDEYIVGILFALISPYLRRPHLLEYQVTHVSLLWR